MVINLLIFVIMKKF